MAADSVRWRVACAVVAVGAWLGVAACNRGALDGPLPDLGGPDALPTATWQWTEDLRTQLDLLFVIDNSEGMGALQEQLVAHFYQVIKPFLDAADRGAYADLQIGVVTTDLGAGATGAPGCERGGGGDGGRLQGLGRAAAPTCKAPVGAPYIHFGPSEVNLPGTQGLLETFACMASVGTTGCGYPHALEAARIALVGGLPENAGFVREDAALAVVFVTNKDDASAARDSPLFDPGPAGDRYGYPARYQRATRRGVVCGLQLATPPDDDSQGALGPCQAAWNALGDSALLLDVTPYQQLLRAPRAEGGVKDDPSTILAVGLIGPSAPFSVMRADPGIALGQPLVACPTLAPGGKPPCVARLRPSCGSGTFAAEPAVRLTEVIGASQKRSFLSACADDPSAALVPAFDLLRFPTVPKCLTHALPHDGTGQPVIACTVVEERLGSDGSVRQRAAIPRCEGEDPDAPHAKVPCWVVAPLQGCAAASPDGLGLVIDRGRDGASGVPVLPARGTTVRVSCVAGG